MKSIEYKEFKAAVDRTETIVVKSEAYYKNGHDLALQLVHETCKLVDTLADNLDPGDQALEIAALALTSYVMAKRGQG